MAGIDRLTIEDGRLVAHPPTTPGGPPDGRTTIREIRLDLPARVGDDGRPYVTAPPDCETGTWVSRAHYEFADGGATSLDSASPCTQPALDVSVRPARVRAGTTHTFRVAARSADLSCVQRAKVRVAGRRARTGPAGRARVTLRLGRLGLRRVVVAKPGCRPASAVIRVRPARS